MDQLKLTLARVIQKATNQKGIIDLFSIPPDSSLGDLSLPCFKFGKNPVDAAKKLAKIKLPKGFDKVITKGPYLNFFYDKTEIIKSALEYKEIKPKKNEKVMVEYSQPNTHKAFHIGHLRNVVLGDAIVRILRASGYKVIAANYIGDIGTHVAKSLWYIDKYCKKLPDKDYGNWLADVYVKATKKVSENERLKEEISQVLQKFEKGDKHFTALWKKTYKWSMDTFYAIYKELDVNFDIYFFESEVSHEGKKIALDLQKKGIARKDQGSLLVDLDKYKLGKYLVLKSDGTSLYSTKDLELAKRKFKKYNIDRNIYVVGSEQELYFKQLFKTLELMGFPQAKKCYHHSYGLVQLSSGKMSSRLGNVISYDELKNQVLKEAISEVKKRHKDWSKRKIKDTALKISMAALKFTMLCKERKRVIVFNVNESLSFEGESGPYLQYVYTRIKSIFKKAKVKEIKAFDAKVLTTQAEFELAKYILEFDSLISEIGENYKINMLPRYLLDLAQAFNSYYVSTKVLGQGENLTNSRLKLIENVAKTIKRGLNLLGIDVVEEM